LAHPILTLSVDCLRTALKSQMERIRVDPSSEGDSLLHFMAVRFHSIGGRFCIHPRRQYVQGGVIWGDPLLCIGSESSLAGFES
jgi:hypothetical protein